MMTIAASIMGRGSGAGVDRQKQRLVDCFNAVQSIYLQSSLCMVADQAGSQAKLTVRAESYELQHRVIRIPVDQHQVGLMICVVSFRV